jgi:hypothetical protein
MYTLPRMTAIFLILRWSVCSGCLVNTSAKILVHFYLHIRIYRYHLHYYNSLLLYFSHYIVIRGSGHRRGLNWILDLLTALTHDT